MIAGAALSAVRSTASVRTSTPLLARIAAATSSSASCRRATSATLSPRWATARANSAPMPSEAPTTSAHGPYRCAKPKPSSAAMRKYNRRGSPVI